jgi:hypothetical protein
MTLEIIEISTIFKKGELSKRTEKAPITITDKKYFSTLGRVELIFRDNNNERHESTVEFGTPVCLDFNHASVTTSKVILKKPEDFVYHTVKDDFDPENFSTNYTVFEFQARKVS